MGGKQRRRGGPLGGGDLSVGAPGEAVSRSIRLGGGQSLALDFAAGDSFSIAPAEGGGADGKPPPALVWAFRPDGRPDPGALEWE